MFLAAVLEHVLAVAAGLYVPLANIALTSSSQQLHLQQLLWLLVRHMRQHLQQLLQLCFKQQGPDWFTA